jgi:hypothetical protein
MGGIMVGCVFLSVEHINPANGEEYAVLNQGWLAESARLAKSIPVIETFAWH